MSKMSQLSMEVEELYNQGYNPYAIAVLLNVPIELVDGFFSTLDNEVIDPDEWDSAFADGEALASAGFGTDEDYGSF